MEFDRSVYDWLYSLGILAEGDCRSDAGGKSFKANEAVASQFLLGTLFAKTLKAAYNMYPEVTNNRPPPTQETLRHTNSKSAKQFNWNYIGDLLRKMDVVYDNDVRGLILAGDGEMVVDMLRQVHTLYKVEERKHRDKQKSETSTFSPKSTFANVTEAPTSFCFLRERWVTSIQRRSRFTHF